IKLAKPLCPGWCFFTCPPSDVKNGSGPSWFAGSFRFSNCCAGTGLVRKMMALTPWDRTGRPLAGCNNARVRSRFEKAARPTFPKTGRPRGSGKTFDVQAWPVSPGRGDVHLAGGHGRADAGANYGPGNDATSGPGGWRVFCGMDNSAIRSATVTG